MKLRDLHWINDPPYAPATGSMRPQSQTFSLHGARRAVRYRVKGELVGTYYLVDMEPNGNDAVTGYRVGPLTLNVLELAAVLHEAQLIEEPTP